MRPGRTARLRALFVAVSAALAMAAPARAADADGTASALVMLNQYRGDHGRLPVTLDRRLAEAAARHARAMADQDFFSHIGADGSRMGDRVTATGYVWRLVAENLAAGMKDAKAAVQVWIDSPGHRHNLILKDVTHAGLGHVHRDPDPGSVTYKDYWVLLLAAPQ